LVRLTALTVSFIYAYYTRLIRLRPITETLKVTTTQAHWMYIGQRCTHCDAGIAGDNTITLAFFFMSSSYLVLLLLFLLLLLLRSILFFFISFVHRSTAAADPVIRFSTEHFAKNRFFNSKESWGLFHWSPRRNAWEWNKNNAGEEFAVLWAVFLHSFFLDFFSIFLFFYFFCFFLLFK